MKREWSEEELKEIAKQLSNPDGSEGVKTGERMGHGNGQMIHRTIDLLDIKPNDFVLEIGPGNGGHIHSILETCENVIYQGVDISATMVEEANRMNEEAVKSGRVSFVLSNGKTLDFPDHTFDKIFTVNTVYFWGNPLEYAAEIFRVLKTDGIFALSFSDSHFMKNLPFTKFGFQLYDRTEAKELLIAAGFRIQDIIEEIEVTKSNLGDEVERPVIIIIAKKG
jgi:ubiquinone/menaquinone biosynthesis C-methylase UbiE